MYKAEASGPWFLGLNASACSCARVCECYLGAAAPRMPLPYSHTQQMRPGDKENTIDSRSVFFFSPIGSQQRGANCFCYLYQRTNVFETAEQSSNLYCFQLFLFFLTRIIWIFHHCSECHLTVRMVKKKSQALNTIISTELFPNFKPAVTFQSFSMIFMAFKKFKAKIPKEKKTL